MNSQNASLDRVESIFSNAAEIQDLEERFRYLDRECGSDTDLRQQVDDLLVALASPTSSWTSP